MVMELVSLHYIVLYYIVVMIIYHKMWVALHYTLYIADEWNIPFQTLQITFNKGLNHADWRFFVFLDDHFVAVDNCVCLDELLSWQLLC